MNLLESMAAAFVAGVAALGMLLAFNAFGKFAAHPVPPLAQAARDVAARTLRVAQDAWKYGAPAAPPNGNSTIALPVARAGAAPASVPATLSIAASNVTATSATISVTVAYPRDPAHPGDAGSVSVSGSASVQAPLPGSSIAAPSSIPAPSGAP